MTHALLQVIIIACALIAAWLVVARFSPDPLITKLAQIVIFVIALYVIVMKLLPMVGVA